MGQVLDSASHIDPVAAGSAGYVGLIRYLPLGWAKSVDAAEVANAHAAGQRMALVWETSADRARQGYLAGAADALQANAQADQLGWPLDRPIYYAIDFGAQTIDIVAAYFAGVRDNSRHGWGFYGDYSIIEAAAYAGETRWLWQCGAWSGNGAGSGGSIEGRRLSAHAVLYQRGDSTADVGGVTCDVNDVLTTDWGGWLPGSTTTPEDDMAAPSYIQRTSDGTPWLLRPYAGTRKNLATLDGATGEAHVSVLKFVGVEEKPQAQPDGDWFILDLYRDIDAKVATDPAPAPAPAPTTPTPAPAVDLEAVVDAVFRRIATDLGKA